MRRAVALRRLGVSEAQLLAAPDISSLLKKAKGGLKATLAAMRFSADDSVMAFLAAYDEVPERDRISVPWEAVALSVDVGLAALLGGAVLALQTHSANVVKIIAMSNHPSITSARVQFGQLPGGERDRTALDTGLGFLPTAKGNTFIFNREKADAKDEEDEEEGTGADLEHLFPNVSKVQDRLVPMRQRMIDAEVR